MGSTAIGSLGLRQMRGKFAQLSPAHSGDVIKLHIDENVAGEEEHALVERCGQGSDVFDAHERLAIEGEGGIRAGSIFESRGFHRDGAVVMLVGGHFKIGEAILFEHAGGGAVDLARIGAELRRAAELPTGKGLGQNRGGRLGLRKQGRRGEKTLPAVRRTKIDTEISWRLPLLIRPRRRSRSCGAGAG